MLMIELMTNADEEVEEGKVSEKETLIHIIIIL